MLKSMVFMDLYSNTMDLEIILKPHVLVIGILFVYLGINKADHS
jgi:hypothetical protein